MSEVPPHVIEARTWISNWQRTQLEQAVVNEVPEKQKLVKNPFAPSAISPDGTLTFTSVSLTSVSYKQAIESTAKA